MIHKPIVSEDEVHGVAKWLRDYSQELALRGQYGSSQFVGKAAAVLRSAFVEIQVLNRLLFYQQSHSRRWRHKKRDTVYIELGRAELQTTHPVGEGEHLVMYICPKTDKMYARPVTEFEDGRFEEVK